MSTRRARMDRRRRAPGFTLIELTIALFVLALLLGSVLVPLGTQVEQRQIADTEKAMQQIAEALIGFAAANGHLPCPDATSGAGANDGLEDVAATGKCVTTDGNVPWVTLGAGAADPWNNRYRYHVDGEYAARAPAATFTLTTGAGVRTWASAARTTPLTSPDPNGAVALILSHGRNGRGAMSALTGKPNPPPTGVDEAENVNGDLHFVSRPPTQAGNAGGEFDDIVTWLSRYTLYNRMVSAGRLP